MNELPRVRELGDEYERHQRHSAAQVGIEAVEQAIHNETPTDAVEISVWVRGREIRSTVDSATVARIMAILTGLE
jgi:hypothetical protein